ncbi:MAG TPA: (d)CMP kinase [Pseudomonadota bacterium]|nr:(d)CMP kinase [Pseudomonadota bacterium]
MTALSPFPVIAIDGPAGAGKSTVARQLARRLGFFLLDTGAIYRCLALHAQERGVSWDAGPDLAALALLLPIRFGTGPVPSDGSSAGASAPGASATSSAAPSVDAEQVFLGEQVVTQAIRSPEISRGASQVSAHPEVRSALLQLQRQLAATGPCVVEGRDIGTVVLPGAPIKLFLTASADVRAQRRFEELSARGVVADRSATLRDQAERDHRDATRATAPLRQADDALLVDTSALGLEEVLDQIEAICRKRLADWDKSQSH